MPPIILENFVPPVTQGHIEQALLGYQFPWFFYSNTNSSDQQTREDDAPQFVHGFIQDERVASQWTKVPLAVTEALGLQQDAIIRAKANILGRDKAPLVHPKHTDDPNPHWVFIYYVNDADGPTCLFEGSEITHRIEPKRGRGVIFEGKIEHSSSSPVESRYRCILNFNLKPSVSLDAFRA
ncbi:MAG: hypothetical protein AAGH90_05755, partial [Pseudomonadota bacterium]